MSVKHHFRLTFLLLRTEKHTFVDSPVLVANLVSSQTLLIELHLSNQDLESRNMLFCGQQKHVPQGVLIDCELNSAETQTLPLNIFPK